MLGVAVPFYDWNSCWYAAGSGSVFRTGWSRKKSLGTSGCNPEPWNKQMDKRNYVIRLRVSGTLETDDNLCSLWPDFFAWLLRTLTRVFGWQHITQLHEPECYSLEGMDWAMKAVVALGSHWLLTSLLPLSFAVMPCCDVRLLSTQNIYFQQLPIDFDGVLRPQLFHCFQESQVILGRALEQAVLESPYGPWNLLMDSPMGRACFLGSSFPHMTLS